MSEATQTTGAVTAEDFFMTAADVEREYGIDLITAETLRNGLIEVTRHMYTTQLRSSFSNIIRDAMDFGVCLHVVNDDGSTDLVGITEGCTQFAFTHQHLVNMVLDEYGLENLGPGDTLVTNDAYRSGIHFGDLNCLRVIFDEEGRPAFVVSNGAHVFDIGGPVPGGFHHQATTLYEEGLRVPPMLITTDDTIVRPVMNLLVENTRSPFHMVGDVKAILGTLKAGETRVQKLIERYGSKTVKASANYALDLAERRMRKELFDVPDGDYTAEEWLDDDGVVFEPVHLKVVVRVRGARAEIDFSGTDRQPLGAITTCWEDAARCLIGPKVLLDPRHPWNAGASRPFDVLLPAGSAVMALPPTSQSAHVEMGAHIGSLMIQALSLAVPDRGIAPDAGITGSIFLYGTDHRPGREGMPFGSAHLFGESWGGSRVTDGISYCFTPLYNCRSIILEYAEKESPIVFWEFGIVIDSAGAGEFRGGFSAAVTFEVLDETSCTPMLDRTRLPSVAANGGTPGMTTYGLLVDKDERGPAVSWNGILPADRIRGLYGIFDGEGRPNPEDGVFGQGAQFESCHVAGHILEPGTIMRVIAASAGGYGDPLDRDPAAVLRDVRNERVSMAQADETYGVVVDRDTGSVDEDATEARRSELRAARGDSWEPPPSYFKAWPRNASEQRELVASLLPARRVEAAR
ncbi:MAG TPA: hydantoinase B/oxoprolinase family protein [Solirubrobacterales bacterium]|nr:hydantoinase B/oxoprolinase family protein [Solirubrobacterales bacterium]